MFSLCTNEYLTYIQQMKDIHKITHFLKNIVKLVNYNISDQVIQNG